MTVSVVSFLAPWDLVFTAHGGCVCQPRQALLGEASRKIESQLAGTAPVTRAASMEEAVRLAFGQADRGEVVLLAPACSSFDMFRDYEDRGNMFKEAVNRLQ